MDEIGGFVRLVLGLGSEAREIDTAQMALRVVVVYAAYIADRDMRRLGLRGTPPGEPALATRTADPV